MELTFAMIKPDAVERNIIGSILQKIENDGFTIAAMRTTHMSKACAEGFYYVHKERPFFNDLTDYMSSGPVVLLVLKRDNAIARWREVMGATNPKDADEGTIRKEFGIDIEKNSTHGSDATDTAEFEISYFFSKSEIQA